jgi:hypothetical protein
LSLFLFFFVFVRFVMFRLVYCFNLCSVSCLVLTCLCLFCVYFDWIGLSSGSFFSVSLPDLPPGNLVFVVSPCCGFLLVLLLVCLDFIPQFVWFLSVFVLLVFVFLVFVLELVSFGLSSVTFSLCVFEACHTSSGDSLSLFVCLSLLLFLSLFICFVTYPCCSVCLFFHLDFSFGFILVFHSFFFFLISFVCLF